MNSKSSNGLTYFTHEVDGRLYGGWYRGIANLGVEVYLRGQIYRALLGRMSAEERACAVVEEVVQGRPHRTLAQD
ncbi:MAG TPA: hypothetical protein VJ011_00050 [Steroidobacteraceae bacterium]|nr:hypothetical protein [Steroidobacteraceae bacterium]